MDQETKGLKLDFSSAPTVGRFFNSDAFVRGLMGPVGSGKSYACCAEISVSYTHLRAHET